MKLFKLTCVLTVLVLLTTACGINIIETPNKDSTTNLKETAKVEEIRGTIIADMYATQTDEAMMDDILVATTTAEFQATTEIFPDTYGISAIYTNDDNYGVIAVHESGEKLIGITDFNSKNEAVYIEGVVYISPESDAVVIKNGNDGLPEQLVMRGMLFEFNNFSEDSVDVVVTSIEGETEEFLDIPVDPSELFELRTLTATSYNNSGSYKLAKPNYSENSEELIQTLKIMALAASVAGCVTAIILSAGLTFGAALPLVAIPCAAAIISGIKAVADAYNLPISVLSNGFGIYGCAMPEPGSVFACAALILEITTDIVEESGRTVEDIKSMQEEIATEKALPFSYVVIDCVEWYHATTNCDPGNESCQISDVENNYSGNSKIVIDSISIDNKGDINYFASASPPGGYPKYLEKINENSLFSIPAQDLSTQDHDIQTGELNITFSHMDSINILGRVRPVIVLYGEYFITTSDKCDFCPDGEGRLGYEVSVTYFYDQKYGLLLRSELESVLDSCSPGCSGLEGTTVMRSIAEVVESDWKNE